jgi:hypothetical protein
MEQGNPDCGEKLGVGCVGNKTNGEHKGKSKKIKINFFNFLKQICI